MKTETFTDYGPTKEYHYTLYYYDQAGNLVQTVPPSGVVPLTDAELQQFSKSKGLVAHYPFTADLRDYSNSGLNLTQTTGTPVVISNTEGVRLYQNTSLESIDTKILDNEQHTIDFWAKFPTTTTNTGYWGKVFGYMPDLNGDSWYSFAPIILFHPNNTQWNSQNYLLWDYNNADDPEGYVYHENLTTNQWYHITGVKKDNSFAYYQNGVKIQDAWVPTGSPYGERIAPLVFGNGKPDWWGGADVYLKDFKIFNRSLTDAEVAALNTSTTKLRPTHTLVTQYWYNALNKVTRQTSPDGGTSLFWYDYLGRLILSQNANQRDAKTYSYTNYDKLGRTVEVGQIAWSPNQTWENTDINVYYKNVNDFVQTLRSAGDLMNGTPTATQITHTYYDKSPPQYNGVIANFTPENLRNRVAVVSYTSGAVTAAVPIDMATYYSYDIAGNVKTIVHNIPALAAQTYTVDGVNRTHQFKRLDYDYDLVSGKVNNLYYQKSEPDQFIYCYTYDKDNRLQDAKSSIDGYKWTNEATYIYYKHGPLSRIVLGRKEKPVQGLDYAYTLQGWIKGLNASFLDPNRDIGKDGISASTVRKDAVGYTINYFDGDYKPIGATAKTDAGRFDVKMTNSSGDYRSKGLFNGNIRSIASQTEGLNNPIFMSYDYDQLNRLNKMESNSLAYNTVTKTYEWNRATTAETKWREDVTYDANGNIQAYKRNDQTGAAMDILKYNYNPQNANQLKSVDDAVVGTTAHPDDVEGSGNTFAYDKIGNIVTETNSSSKVTTFLWNVYGKMTNVQSTNTATRDIQTYFYDAQQNRFKKYAEATVSGVTKITTDYYIRDAQGNVLAIYQAKDADFLWKEQHLYGSSRLGMWQPEKSVLGGFFSSSPTTDGQGLRAYELTNHLGNVLATINDKRKVVSAQDYTPFGMTLTSRIFTVGSAYRFGFNGKEYDVAFKQQDYGMRIYRFNLGRFLSVDPLMSSYPWYTPYQFAGNTPIQAIDLDGAEPYKNYYFFADKIDPKLNLFHADNLVNMDYANKITSWNSLGIARSSEYFWGKWKDTPLGKESLSNRNLNLIEQGKVPTVDKQWNKVMKQFGNEGIMDEIIQHHHNNKGSTATPMPSSVHLATENSEVHHGMNERIGSVSQTKNNVKNRTGRYDPKAVLRRMKTATRGLQVISVLSDLTSIVTQSPSSPVLLFHNIGTLDQNRAYPTGLFGSEPAYYEYHWMGEIGKSNRQIDYFESYKKVDGVWRGEGHLGTDYFNTEGQKVSPSAAKGS